MALGDLTPEGENESSSGGKSTHIKFMNPRGATVYDPDDEELPDDGDISASEKYRHEQQYYDSVQELRNMMGPDINVPFGEFAHAAVQAEKHGNPEPLQELFDELTN